MSQIAENMRDIQIECSIDCKIQCFLIDSAPQIKFIGQDVLTLFNSTSQQYIQSFLTTHSEQPFQGLLELSLFDTLCQVYCELTRSTSMLTFHCKVLDTPIYSTSPQISTLEKEIKGLRWVENYLKTQVIQFEEVERISSVGHWIYNYAEDSMLWSDSLFEILEEEKVSVQPSVNHFFEFISSKNRESIQKNTSNIFNLNKICRLYSAYFPKVQNRKNTYHYTQI